MYASFPASLVALTGILGLAAANPVARSEQHPYFAVRGFSYSKSSTSSRYMFNVSFPVDVVTANGNDPAYTVPGFTDPVPCTGTWFYSPSETETVTLINVCGKVGDGSKAAVKSQLDVEKGILYLEYLYNATSNGSESDFRWNATQTGLSPVPPSAAEGFNTPAYGPPESSQQ